MLILNFSTAICLYRISPHGVFEYSCRPDPYTTNDSFNNLTLITLRLELIFCLSSSSISQVYHSELFFQQYKYLIQISGHDLRNPVSDSKWMDVLGPRWMHPDPFGGVTILYFTWYYLHILDMGKYMELMKVEVRFFSMLQSEINVG